MGVGLAFIYIPLTVVVINSFNVSRTFSWPPKDFTTQWWSKAIENTGVREALKWSFTAGLAAAGLALKSKRHVASDIVSIFIREILP